VIAAPRSAGEAGGAARSGTPHRPAIATFVTTAPRGEPRDVYAGARHVTDLQ
jgi:hypothetical protein